MVIVRNTYRAKKNIKWNSSCGHQKNSIKLSVAQVNVSNSKQNKAGYKILSTYKLFNYLR